MSDDPPKRMNDPDDFDSMKAVDNEAQSITLEDVNAFLSERGANLGCASCGSKNFGMLVPKEKGLHHMAFKQSVDPGTHPTSSVPGLMTGCNNCGLTRVYNALIILQWRRARGGNYE